MNTASPVRACRDRGVTKCAPPSGEHGSDGKIGAAQQTDQLERLVGGNAAGDDEEDPAAQGYSRQPEWMAAMPPERFLNSTRAKPACVSMPASLSWSGNMRMLSAR